MRNDTGTNLWLMGWLFFVGYALAKEVQMEFWEWVVSIVIWPAQFASILVTSGAL